MADLMKMFSEKNVHVAFEISLALKGVFALAEIGAGIFAYFTTTQFLLDLVHIITRAELMEDPRDFVANYLSHAAQDLSVSSQHFAAFYLLSHGAIKLWLIIGLWRKKPGYYPAAIAVFSFFILYQLYRYSFSHSVCHEVASFGSAGRLCQLGSNRTRAGDGGRFHELTA
jgi:uncharacterized membrane protein